MPNHDRPRHDALHSILKKLPTDFEDRKPPHRLPDRLAEIHSLTHSVGACPGHAGMIA
jgi:hypothetical protein